VEILRGFQSGLGQTVDLAHALTRLDKTARAKRNVGEAENAAGSSRNAISMAPKRRCISRTRPPIIVRSASARRRAAASQMKTSILGHNRYSTLPDRLDEGAVVAKVLVGIFDRELAYGVVEGRI